MGDAQMEEGDNTREIEVAPALIAVDPAQRSVAVAVGSDLRVYDLIGDCPVSLVDDSAKPFHSDSIRAIRYDASGKLFVSAGDDKLVKIWSTDSWFCISSVCCEKRVSAVAVSNDGLFVCFADKFGVVWVVSLKGDAENQALADKKAAPMLAHYCSIITSLEFSPDGRFIVSADRDYKIRVTVVPKNPLDGAHEIQTFCLGHSEYVSCLDFIHSPDYPHGLLISGSGDSTVRLWDVTLGSLLDTCEIGSKAELSATDGIEEDPCHAVTDLCTCPNGTSVALAVQSLKGIMLLNCNLSAKTLSMAKVVLVEGETLIPTSLGTSLSEGLLWMVTGISKLQGFDHSSLARVRAVSFPEDDGRDAEPVLLRDDEIPGGQKLLERLQGSVSIGNDVFLAASEALKTSMRSLLIKKQYSDEKREFRKRTRNDRKLKH
ncbi:tRNA (guanine-N(7)-)-methyltransferase non-catalytic subunit wdr4 isoform X2 [Rhodamnia argentea]|uniref:tRNA (guanine-N(7)-)-methyltransferase non-catalytic subunit n=1 Tax=Rhodamnia argentea TaxID=178133 RepID=A0A8B8QFP1_9MYRT|nr:tRNA (guanine-N(7)-)-methyltransferase non-catalytic subunit wdr4 isoform X2 [Rhodamnia argentea]